MTQTFKTLLKTINDALTINLTKEVAHFSIKGYRVDQLALPEVNVRTIEELVVAENCVAIETSHIANMLKKILEEDLYTNMYLVSAFSFQKNKIYIDIEKVNVNPTEKNIQVSITFNIANAKVEFGRQGYNGFRLEKETMAVMKSIKIGSFTVIPQSLSKKDFENMTPIDFIEYKIAEDDAYKARMLEYKEERENAFTNELAKHNISLEDFNTLKRMQPSS